MITPPPYSPHDLVDGGDIPAGADPIKAHIPGLPALPAPPLLDALRARSSHPPVPSSAPGALCRNCRWSITTGPLSGDCRKLAITTTTWGAIAGMPGNSAAASWQVRADAEATAAAAYRSGDTADCAPRSARVVAK